MFYDIYYIISVIRVSVTVKTILNDFWLLDTLFTTDTK